MLQVLHDQLNREYSFGAEHQQLEPTPQQLKAVNSLIRKALETVDLSWIDSPDGLRLGIFSLLVGREIATTRDLTKWEVSRVIDYIKDQSSWEVSDQGEELINFLVGEWARGATYPRQAQPDPQPSAAWADDRPDSGPDLSPDWDAPPEDY